MCVLREKFGPKAVWHDFSFLTNEFKKYLNNCLVESSGFYRECVADVADVAAPVNGVPTGSMSKPKVLAKRWTDNLLLFTQ